MTPEKRFSRVQSLPLLSLPFKTSGLGSPQRLRSVPGLDPPPESLPSVPGGMGMGEEGDFLGPVRPTNPTVRTFRKRRGSSKESPGEFNEEVPVSNQDSTL